MDKYEVEFFETIRHVVTIEAENKEDAMDKAEDVYYNGEPGEKYSESAENTMGLIVKVV